MNEILITITGLISVGGSAFFGWIFGRRKSNAEAQTTEIDNEIRMSNYYKEMLDDLRNRYEKKYQDYEALMNSKEKVLREEVTILNRKIEMLQTENTELRKRVVELERLTKNANKSLT
ncbi:hypothetical protein [Empedobacter sp. UBA7248]|uniref:hypothetical protein n=1 Tax=Empedobacter sp. UBA7248 TaxID=1946448 RepID=UPI0025BD7C1B|nr:hypothetical protein [Empedobacter sp. UBA7248]